MPFHVRVDRAMRPPPVFNEYRKLAELLATIPCDAGVIERADKIDHDQIERAVAEGAKSGRPVGSARPCGNPAAAQCSQLFTYP